MIKIRPFEEMDWAATWQIIEPVFRAGETYAFSPDITEDEVHQIWVRDACLRPLLLWMETTRFLAPTTSSQTNLPLGPTSVTVVTLLQKRPAARVSRPKCAQHSQLEAIARGLSSDAVQFGCLYKRGCCPALEKTRV